LTQTNSNFLQSKLKNKMATIQLITEAVLALKDRTGSSVIAINKWIEAEKKVS